MAKARKFFTFFFKMLRKQHWYEMNSQLQTHFPLAKGCKYEKAILFSFKLKYTVKETR